MDLVEIAAPDLTVTLSDRTLACDADMELVVEVISPTDDIITDELSADLLPGEYLDGICNH